MATETFREWRIPPADIGRAQYEALLAHPNFPAAAHRSLPPCRTLPPNIWQIRATSTLAG